MEEHEKTLDEYMAMCGQLDFVNLFSLALLNRERRSTSLNIS